MCRRHGLPNTRESADQTILTFDLAQSSNGSDDRHSRGNIQRLARGFRVARLGIQFRINPIFDESNLVIRYDLVASDVFGHICREAIEPGGKYTGEPAKQSGLQ